jgi:nucleoside 2-deoxyribosyltransferase
MNEQANLIESVNKFRNDFPDYQNTAFLMMRFENTHTHKKIVEIVKDIFKQNGITLLRADDKQYHSDMFNNVQTYMHCCGMGVAIFDAINSNDFNPNVSLEIGYMMALEKPILYLKDKKLNSLHSDLFGKLYKEFDSYSLEDTLEECINKWIKDNDLCFTEFNFSITIKSKIKDLANNPVLLDSVIKKITSYSFTALPVVQQLQYVNSDFETKLVFKGTLEFFKNIQILHERNNLFIQNDIEVVDISPITNHEDGNYFDNWSIQETFSGDVCRLSGFHGLEHLKIEAQRFLPKNNVNNRPKDCCIYITIDDRSRIYFQSNFINISYHYPTKLLTNPNKFKLIDAVKLIFGHKQLLGAPNEEQIVICHYLYIKYFVNEKLKDNPYFDISEVRNVHYVKV